MSVTAQPSSRPRRLVTRVAAFLALGVGVAGLAPMAPASAAEVPVATLVITHPWAAAQPTVTGRALLDLAVHGGQVFAGFGDYGANTGPITLAGYDPAAGTFAQAVVADTEAVYNLRQIGGGLYAPSTDPRGPGDFAASDPWRNQDAVGSSHVFDMATLDGTDRWMVGSAGNDAVAWRSTDGGATWAEALRVPPVSGYARFYFAGVQGGRLRVQAVDSAGGPQPMSKVFDGATWTDGPTLLPAGGLGWAPETFGGDLVYHDFGHGYLSSILRFDGASARSIASGYDVTVNGGKLYVLESGRVMASTDGATWTQVAIVPNTARSLVVDGSTLWVGTTDAELWSAPLTTTPTVIPQPPAVIVPPTVEPPTVGGKPTRAPKPAATERPVKATKAPRAGTAPASYS